MSIKKLVFLGFVLLLYNCKSARITKGINKTIDTKFYDNQFTGILVYNPKTKDTIFSHNADKYFTPASNTKIITLYTALQLIGTKIPAYKYSVEEDTITIQGTGDPTFLHLFFNDSTALKEVKKFTKVNLILNNFSEGKLGSGWAWDDYDAYYSPERSSFPMYGNIVTISNQEGLQSIPKILEKDVHYSSTKRSRDLTKNQFYYNPTKNKIIETPIIIDSLSIAELWNDILPGKVYVTNKSSKKMEHTAYNSVPPDSLYKRMMTVSDNFLAEQILLLASSTFSDTLSSKKVRDFILNNQLKDLKQKPRWVDGSGLSRYNLFTPTSFVQILTKLYDDVPRERLFNLFPAAGKSGTIKKWYAGDSTPYIYAKSGSLSNNHSLSGYLITNSGETLIFSFMNNHYRTSTSEVKKRMQTVFEFLRDNY